MIFFFWITLCILVYTWGGYAFVLFIATLLKTESLNSQENYTPSVTILLTVHNEEELIEQRIQNIFDTNFSLKQLKILVVSDGSTDRTEDKVGSLMIQHTEIELFSHSGGGKSCAQNAAIPFASGELIILTDADTMFQSDTIHNLVRHFADKQVGCVTGRVILRKEDNSISESHGFYWKYELLIRRLESRLGTLHTASGPIMAFRKSLFRPFNAIYGDDCIIPLNILSQGFIVMHDDQAVAFDTFPSSVKGEFNARVRMTLRNLTCTLSNYSLLLPHRHPLIAFSIISHKILRWLTPYFMISLFSINLFIISVHPIYKGLFYFQLGFYGLGVVGFISERNQMRIPIASQIFSFTLANAGFFLGVLKAMFGYQIKKYRN